jgi:hypothetical protein
LPSLFGGYLLHILVAIIIVLVMVGSYFAVSFVYKSASKEVWSTNPVSIIFSGSVGSGSSGSAVDSFKCAPPVTNVNLQTVVNNPTKISLTLSQYSFVSCGPPFSTITLTARCVVSNCKGTYTGTVTIFRDEYDIVPTGLQVTIVVK